MKKALIISLITISNWSYSQIDSTAVEQNPSTPSVEKKFNHHISASFTGILNYKVRVQYERQLGKKGSFGANVNYYAVNWTGITIEPFARIYSGESASASGFFGQFKLIYGNLKVLDYDLYSAIYENRRWSTFGLGIAGGYKFLIKKHFTIEPLMGFRFASGPIYRFKEGTSELTAEGIGENVGWYLTTGMPVDFQLKFGWQF